MVRGDAPVLGRPQPAVLGDGPEPVEHAPLGHPGDEPHERVHPPAAGQRPQPDEQHHLPHDDAQCDAPGGGRQERVEQQLQVLPAGLAVGVAPQLPVPRVLGERVAVVEDHVRLGRAELLLVVRHVAAAVRLERHERRIGAQPAADPVVDLAVGEQQPVGGLVAEDREPHHGPAHQQEREQPGDDLPRPGDAVRHPGSQQEDAERLDPDADHMADVLEVGDAVELLAQRTERPTGRGERLGGQHVGQHRRVGLHRPGCPQHVWVHAPRLRPSPRVASTA